MKSIPHLTFLTLIIKKPVLLTIPVPAVVAMPLVVDFMGLSVILFWLFVADLGTGIFASYCEWKKTKTTDKWFFGTGKENGFSSQKAKQSFTKALVYVALPYLLINFQKMLLIKNFKYERLSDAEFELASLAVILFILVEGFSIFHENLPKCGFNIWITIKKMLGVYKKVKNEVI